jgi:membrane protease YdiL (CAAX protease family)
MITEPRRLAHHQNPPRGAVLALLPIGATIGYYWLPGSHQEELLVQFVPQLLAYLAMSLWASRAFQVLAQLGLEKAKVGDGLKWGLITGLLLGGLNTFVMLAVYPSFGYDITFLKQTPHGRLPVLLMVPWLICGIALFVELNFRGFLLGRLAELESSWWRTPSIQKITPMALIASAVTFAFDPFMVNTFRHLHWIALWDGLIWGSIWLRTRNLWITIVAHTVEVIILYSVVRAAIG